MKPMTIMWVRKLIIIIHPLSSITHLKRERKPMNFMNLEMLSARIHSLLLIRSLKQERNSMKVQNAEKPVHQRIHSVDKPLQCNKYGKILQREINIVHTSKNTYR